MAVVVVVADMEAVAVAAVAVDAVALAATGGLRVANPTLWFD